MSPTRLVVRDARIEPGEMLIPVGSSHHARVTRVVAGEAVEVLDLAGSIGVGRFVGWEGRRGRVGIDEVLHGRGEPPAPLVLALGVLHTDAFAWAVEKATELGATRVVPLLSERVQGRAHVDRSGRWRRVAEAAVAQCGRSRAPVIDEPTPLGRLLGASIGLRLVADPEAAPPAVRGEAARDGIVVLVGPEGGFSDEERAEVAAAGLRGMPLGPRTLRAETAAVAALVLAQRLAGWF
jgi:16S rRNA (uracil1498-N3)-methyltransferase